MKNHLQLLFLCVYQLIFSQTVTDFKAERMKQGVLPNGMQYYIMQNETPKGRAAFYFAQNVGSILEEDNQRGLAHFLEHMAFNGTQHFPDKQMLKYLEKNGVQFGSEINAFTKYDETVYSIRNVPTQNPKLIDSVLLVLHDWSGYLTLDDEEIDNERGVVHEEWRTRYSAQKRAKDSVLELGLLKNSKYADRSPIGLMNVIDNFEYNTLRKFYKKWYRPDQQAVIIVGDIDEDEVAQKVKELFGNIPLSNDLPERPKFEVPLKKGNFVYLPIKDQELRIPSIEYYFKHKPDSSLTQTQQLERALKLQTIRSILDARLTSKAGLPNSPVYSARFSTEDVVRTLQNFKIELQPKKDSLLTSIAWIATELKRFALYGATDKEFERTKSSLIRSFKSKIEKGGSSNVYHAIEIYEAFFKQQKLPDYIWENEFQLNYLDSIDKNDLLLVFEEYYNNASSVVAILGSDTLHYPDEKQVISTIKKVNDSNPEPYQEIEIEAKELSPLDLPGSKIVEEEQLKELDAISYTLANGAQVLLAKPISEMEGVYLKAISPGGRSLLEEDLLSNSLFAPHFSAESGIANLSKKQLYKSNEVILPSVKIEDYQELLESYTNVDNLEKLNKGIYLSFTSPRFDETIFDTTRNDLERLLALLSANVQSNLADSLQMAKTNYSKREVHLNKQLLQDLSMSKMKKAYADRIKNAADFKFIFMGDVPKEKFENLIEKYIGSIGGNSDTEQMIDQDLRPTPGINKLHMKRKMQTPQASVIVYLTGEITINTQNELILQVIEQLLTKRYMEEIREEEGGTYGVRVNAGLKYLPTEAFELNISFNGNPEKTNRLVDIVYEELNALSHSIDNIAFAEIKSNLKKAEQEKKENNKLYFDRLVNSLETGEILESSAQRIFKIENLTEEDIMQVSKKIMENPRLVEAILSPASADSK